RRMRRQVWAICPSMNDSKEGGFRLSVPAGMGASAVAATLPRGSTSNYRAVTPAATIRFPPATPQDRCGAPRRAGPAAPGATGAFRPPGPLHANVISLSFRDDVPAGKVGRLVSSHPEATSTGRIGHETSRRVHAH